MIAEGLELDASFYGEKTLVVSKSGGGKSYTVRVIIEDGLKLGGTFVVFDPQEAYKNLPDFDYVNADDVTNVKAFGQLIALTNKNIVISTKGMTEEKANTFMRVFLTQYRRYAQKGIKTIVIDELHKFAPEGQQTASKSIVRGMSQEDRSDGTGFIGVSQRVARVDKTIVGQANNRFIGQLDENNDVNAVKSCFHDKSIEKEIRHLPVGTFYMKGIGEPRLVKIRKAETEHSGNAPKTLLTENSTAYNNAINKIVKNKRHSTKIVTATKQVKTMNANVNSVVPSFDTFGSLAKKGAKMSLGLGASGLVGALASRVKSPIPFVSSRTLGSAVTTIVLYAGHRNIPNNTAQDVLGYAAAGSAVFTAGSLVADVIAISGIRVPRIAQAVMTTMTGVPPINVEGNNGVDLNTAHAQGGRA